MFQEVLADLKTTDLVRDGTHKARAVIFDKFDDRVIERIETCSKRVSGWACCHTGLKQAGQVLRRLPHALHHLPLEQLAVQLAHLGVSFELFDSVVDVVVTVVCFVLASRPPSWESGKPITLEGKLLPHRARRVIDLFFQLPTLLAHNLKRQKLILVLCDWHLLGKQGRLGAWVHFDNAFFWFVHELYLMI